MWPVNCVSASHPALPVDVVTVAKKIEHSVQRPSRTWTMKLDSTRRIVP